MRRITASFRRAFGSLLTLTSSAIHACAEWSRYVSGFRETRSKTSAVVPSLAQPCPTKGTREGKRRRSFLSRKGESLFCVSRLHVQNPSRISIVVQHCHSPRGLLWITKPIMEAKPRDKRKRNTLDGRNDWSFIIVMRRIKLRERSKF